MFGIVLDKLRTKKFRSKMWSPMIIEEGYAARSDMI